MGVIKYAAPVVAICVLLAGAGFAVENEGGGNGDAEYGRGLAIRWCGQCHAVTADQKRSMPGAPSFVTIAQSGNMNGDRLARLLLSPHPKMERLTLSRSAVDDIAAYIISLKK
jgi:mono/diheme cytochrome c family protein